MSTSTYGQLCYGIDVGEDFPIDLSKFDYDVEEWWLFESGYRWEGKEVFTEAGAYAPGVKRSDPVISEYFDSCRKWQEEHPIPIKLVNTCNPDCELFIVAVPGTFHSASRGYPKRLDLHNVLLIDPEKLEAWKNFCAKYDIKGESGWYLSTFWGAVT